MIENIEKCLDRYRVLHASPHTLLSTRCHDDVTQREDAPPWGCRHLCHAAPVVGECD